MNNHATIDYLILAIYIQVFKKFSVKGHINHTSYDYTVAQVILSCGSGK